MSDPIVTLDEVAVLGELKELVRQTVEDALNVLLEEEAGDLVGAGRYEHAADREACRAGPDERGPTTISGQVAHKTPKLKGMRFATAIIERYKRREASVKEVMIETHLAGAFIRRIEDISEILWGSSVPTAPSPISTTGRSRPLRNGGAGRRPASAPTCSSMCLAR